MRAATVTEPKRRRDAGIPRQTARDVELLEWLSQQYGAPLDVLAAAAGVTQSRVYALVSRWTRAGWAEGPAGVDAGPSWVWPTGGTARQMLGWDAPMWRPSASQAAHTRAVAAVRLHMAKTDLTAWTSERVLRHQQEGWRSKGARVPHLPDGLYRAESGEQWAVEVELRAKTPDRLASILTDLRSKAAPETVGVVYFVAAGETANVVTHAIEQRRRFELEQYEQAQQVGKWAPTPWRYAVEPIEEVQGWSAK